MNLKAEKALKEARKNVFSSGIYTACLFSFMIGALAPFTITSFLLVVALYFPLGFLVETTKAYKRLNKK